VRGQAETAERPSVRSKNVIARSTTLAPSMIQPMVPTPASVTCWWKTMPMMADEAIEPI
jgi:hypothetical protein